MSKTSRRVSGVFLLLSMAFVGPHCPAVTSLDTAARMLAEAQSLSEVRNALYYVNLWFSARPRLLTERGIAAHPELEPTRLRDLLEKIQSDYPNNENVRGTAGHVLVHLMGQEVTPKKVRGEIEDRIFRQINENPALLDTLKRVVAQYDLSESGLTKLIGLTKKRSTALSAIEVLGNLKSKPEKARDALIALALAGPLRPRGSSVDLSYMKKVRAIISLERYDDLKAQRTLLSLLRNRKAGKWIRDYAFSSLVGSKFPVEQKRYNGKKALSLPVIQRVIRELAEEDAPIARRARYALTLIEKEAKPDAERKMAQQDGGTPSQASAVHREN